MKADSSVADYAGRKGEEAEDGPAKLNQDTIKLEVEQV